MMIQHLCKQQSNVDGCFIVIYHKLSFFITRIMAVIVLIILVFFQLSVKFVVVVVFNIVLFNFTEAAVCLEKAIDIYTDMGRFTMAAKQHQNIAEMYETEAVDLERAINNYEKAADYFMAEESKSSANKCKLKVAQYAAQLEDYERAIQIYEEVL